MYAIQWMISLTFYDNQVPYIEKPRNLAFLNIHRAILHVIIQISHHLHTEQKTPPKMCGALPGKGSINLRLKLTQMVSSTCVLVGQPRVGNVCRVWNILAFVEYVISSGSYRNVSSMIILFYFYCFQMHKKLDKCLILVPIGLN